MFFVDRFDQELMEILAVKEKVSIFKSIPFLALGALVLIN